MMNCIARVAASRVKDYTSTRYLGFSPSRPVIRLMQRALTDIKVDGQLTSTDQAELRRQLHNNRIAIVDAANSKAASADY